MTAGNHPCAASIRQALLAEPAQTLTRRRTQQPTGRHVQRRVDLLWPLIGASRGVNAANVG